MAKNGERISKSYNKRLANKCGRVKEECHLHSNEIFSSDKISRKTRGYLEDEHERAGRDGREMIE